MGIETSLKINFAKEWPGMSQGFQNRCLLHFFNSYFHTLHDQISSNKKSRICEFRCWRSVESGGFSLSLDVSCSNFTVVLSSTLVRHPGQLSYIHACLYLTLVRFLPPFPRIFAVPFSFSLFFVPPAPSEQTVSVSSGTVSINLTITARWISRNGYILRRGSQLVLVPCSPWVCVHVPVAHARARVYPRGLLWICGYVRGNRLVGTGYQGESPLATSQLPNCEESYQGAG